MRSPKLEMFVGPPLCRRLCSLTTKPWAQVHLLPWQHSHYILRSLQVAYFLHVLAVTYRGIFRQVMQGCEIGQSKNMQP